MFWVFDPAARELVFASEALRDHWGFEPGSLASVCGRPLLERVVRSERRATLAGLRAGLANGALDLCTTLRERDGALRRARIHGALEIWPAARRPLFVGWMQDLTRESELTRLVDDYRAASETDSLTSIPNRRGLEARMRQELAAVTAEESAAILIDLDDFKAINDRHGHYVGDRVLEIAARRLGSALRSTDLIGRIGGDEFVVVLPGSDARTGYEVSKRMREAMNDARIQVDGQALQVRASFALTLIESSPEVGIDEVLFAVRRLMTAAKRRGKDGLATPEGLDDAGSGGWHPADPFLR